MIILENIKSNELSFVFSEIVSKGLCCDKVLGDFDFSILHTYPWYLQKVALKESYHLLIVFPKSLQSGLQSSGLS